MPKTRHPKKSSKAKPSAKRVAPGSSSRKGTARTASSRGVKVEGQLAGRPMHSITGQLILDGAKDAIAWYAYAFGAKQLDLKPLPDGRVMHAVLQVGDTMFMVSDPLGPAGSAPKELNGAFLHIQDRNIDDMWRKAIATGAKAHLPLENQFWGDRYGQLRDPYGQLWSFGWPAKMTGAEKQRLMQKAMSAAPPGAERIA